MPIGLGVGIPVVALAIIGAVLFALWRRRNKRNAQAVDGGPANPGNGPMVGMWGKPNIQGSGVADSHYAPKMELHGETARAEMDGTAEGRQGYRNGQVHELS